MKLIPIPLSELKRGESARVVEIKLVGDCQELLRLMEMGLVEGARVRVARRAPLGDPLELEVRTFDDADVARLCLRKAEAARFLGDRE